MENWINLSQTAGTGNATITVSASSYSALTSRVTSLTVSGLSASTSVSILQNGIPATPEDYLTLVILSDGVINWRTSTATGAPIEYSINRGAWNSVPGGQGTISVSTGDEVRFRGDNTKVGPAFVGSTPDFNVKGNAMSLLNSTSFSGMTDFTDTDAFWELFMGTNVVDASEMFLPATGLTNWCYEEMFRNCSKLEEAPALSATVMSFLCYGYLFENCTSLVQAPALPATTLAERCYESMFKGCSNLAFAPALQASTLQPGCYKQMFDGCTNLTSAPSLPSTSLANECYVGMFSGCTSITTPPELPASGLTTYCYRLMFSNCSGLTSAPVLASTNLAVGCYKGMFFGCTSLTTAPDLPATTLTSRCYATMFTNCTGLTTVPNLPAAELLTESYYQMFWNCSSLSYVKCLARFISANKCTMDWMHGVPNSGTFVKKPSMSGWTTGASGIPSGWTVIDAT